MRLFAGAARTEIVLGPDALPLNGFDVVHDPLCVRTLVLDDGVSRAVVVLVDQTSLTADSVAEVKAVVSEVGGVSASAVLVVASHTFSAPHVLPAPLVPPGESAARAALSHAIATAVRESAGRAVAALRPARLRAGQGTCVIGVNRDVETAGGWWHGADEHGVRDPALPVLVLDDESGGPPIAVVTAVAAQSSILDGSVTRAGRRAVSGDLVGAASRCVEQRWPGSVALVLTGAAGDQAPIFTARRYLRGPDGAWTTLDAHDEGFLLVELLGERLGGEILRTAIAAGPVAGSSLALERGSVALDAQVMPPDVHAIRPARDYEFVPDGTTEAPWVLLHVGEAVLVGVQAELSASTGIALRAASPFAHTLVSTLVDGGAKYMVDAGAYDRITYEAMNSRFARGSAERFAAAITRHLHALHG